MDLRALLEIGLTESEAKVYLALMHLGEATRGDIVAQSGASGSKIYDILERLQEKGLASVYTKDKIKHFKATHPDQIKRYLDNKKEKIETAQHSMEQFLPTLLSMYNTSKEDQEVELLTGMKGLEIFFMEQIERCKKGETCYVIGGTTGNDEEALIAFFQKVQKMRKDKGLITKMLYNADQIKLVKNAYQQNAPEIIVRYIDHTSPVAINIYKERTAIIVFGRKITTIHIRSQSVANSFLQYFEILWAQGKTAEQF